MPDRSPALDAAVRAVRGESDLDAVWSALVDERLARVIACAPDADPVVRAVAALCGRLSDLLDPSIVADPALHAALVRLIGTPEGRTALWWWARVAPAGWGAAHAAALTDAVQRRRCDPGVAAALIGPGDESAALLSDPDDAAFAICRWGQSDPGAPTAWAGALSAGERRRLLDAALRVCSAVASCLPWLPPDIANRMRLDDVVIPAALDAFSAASPTARTQHAAFLRRLVACTHAMHLAALTRLACVMDADDVWRRVQALVESPDDAWRVVTAAPWDDLPENVRAAASAVHPAIAVARGEPHRTAATGVSAAAFFAALDPAVWDALDPAVQQRWRHALPCGDAHLAVRSLGLRADILARAAIHNRLVRAALRHGLDDAGLRWALLPVALDAVAPPAVHALTAALPLPPDPGVFFFVASGHDDPSVIARARSALRTPGDLACAVALQRNGDVRSAIRDRCAALRCAMRGRLDDDLGPILALLTDDARAALLPDTAALARRLAHPDRQDALRHALDRLAALPPEVAIPTTVALHRRATWWEDASGTADALADALCGHGDLLAAMVDTLADERLCGALLPLPTNAALADALRAMAQDDPVTARRLAHALWSKNRRTALVALLEATPHHAVAVWGALDAAARRRIGAVLAAVSPGADSRAVSDPLAALALAAVHAHDADLRTAGVTALAARPDVLRACWTALPPQAQQMLGRLPAVADLPPAPARFDVRRERLRGRR